jgi:tetratricopeptide (TPR) repeat protein
MVWIHGLAAVAAFVLQESAPAPNGHTPAPSEGSSVEAFVKEAKERAAKMHSAATGRLAQLLLELDKSYDKNPEKMDATITEILGFKEVSTGLLVKSLEEPKDSHRAQNAARALARSQETNVMPELQSAITAGGTPEKRARIAWVLGRRGGEAAITQLRSLLSDADSTVVGQAALGLSNQKVKDAAMPIAERLDKAAPSLARNLLLALAALEEPKTVPHIVAFIDSTPSAECASAVAEAIRKLKAKEMITPSLRLVARGGSPTDEAADVVRAVETVITSSDREGIVILKKILAESGMSFEVKEECAYALHAAKDPSGKTWLLQPVSEAIRENPAGVTLLRSRGRIYLRLKLYKESQRDYEEIKKISANGKKVSFDQDLYVEIARAFAGTRTWSKAEEALRGALGVGARPSYFRDYPEFVDMRKIAKHAPVFEGD